MLEKSTGLRRAESRGRWGWWVAKVGDKEDSMRRDRNYTASETWIEKGAQRSQIEAKDCQRADSSEPTPSARVTVHFAEKTTPLPPGVLYIQVSP